MKSKKYVYFLLGVLALILFIHQISKPVYVALNADEIDHIEIVSRGQSAQITSDAEIAQVVENMQSLFVKPYIDTSIGWSFELKFYGTPDLIRKSIVVTGPDGLHGYRILKGRVDIDLLESLYQKHKEYQDW